MSPSDRNMRELFPYTHRVVSRYASKEAMERHEASQNYKDFFAKVMEEKMLEGAPVLLKGEPRAGFRR